MKTNYILKTLIMLFFGFTVAAQQTIKKSSIDNGGDSASAGNIQVLYTIGEVAVQETSAGDIIISEGFINALQLIIKIDPKIFLQGPYNTGSEMLDGLRSSNLLPTTSPYIDVKTCAASVFDVTGTNAIIDWVWVEIRDSSDGIAVITSTSALLQANGNVVDVDGVSALTLNITAGNYYVILAHRNHLGIRSANTISLAGGTQSIDLTGDNALIAGGTNAIKDMGDGNFALYAGDYNGDGQIQNTDKNAVGPLRGLSGYNNADIDMNSEVQNSDINSVLNPNLGKGEQFTSRMLFAKRKTNLKQ